MIRPARLVIFLTVISLVAVGGACSRPDATTAAGGHHDEIPAVGEGGLAVAVPGFDLAVGGPQRVVVGLFTSDRTDIGYGEVDLRFRWLGDGQTTANDPAYGPEVTAEFRLLPGTATAEAPGSPAVLTPDQGRGVYVTQAAFDRPGFWEVQVQGDIAGTDGDVGIGAFDVLPGHLVPAVGDQAIVSDNATMTTADVSPESIDSRAGAGVDVPDPRLHRSTIREALDAHRPAVVVFSTPTYCLSRFCGPVTDLVDQLAATYADRAEFIHIEIWEDFDANRINPTAEQWLYRDGNLQEPWVFLIGADGTITARWDNVLIQSELEAELTKLPTGAR